MTATISRSRRRAFVTLGLALAVVAPGRLRAQAKGQSFEIAAVSGAQRFADSVGCHGRFTKD